MTVIILYYKSDIVTFPGGIMVGVAHEDFIPCQMFFLGVVLLICLLALMYLIRLKRKHQIEGERPRYLVYRNDQGRRLYHQRQKEGKRPRYLGIYFLVIVLVIGMVAEAYMFKKYDDYRSKQSLSYGVYLSSNSSKIESVIVPICENSRLLDNIYIEPENFTYFIIETSHGKGLRVYFIGNVSIQGEFEIKGNVGNHELTMRNGTDEKEGRGNIVFREYWIHYLPSDTSDYNCSISVGLMYWERSYNEVIYYEGGLIAGWSTYPFSIGHADE